MAQRNKAKSPAPLYFTRLGIVVLLLVTAWEFEGKGNGKYLYIGMITKDINGDTGYVFWLGLALNWRSRHNRDGSSLLLTLIDVGIWRFLEIPRRTHASGGAPQLCVCPSDAARAR